MLEASEESFRCVESFFSQSVCKSSNPQLEVFLRLKAALFTFPKNINVTKNLPFHNTWTSGNFELLPVMCSQCQIRKPWISLSVRLVYRTDAHAKLLDVIWQLGMVERCQPDYLAQNVSFNKERSRFLLAWKFTKYSVLAICIFKMLAARKTYMITACARKNKRTARMLASARKDHSIPLQTM